MTSEDIDLERRVARIERELDIDPYTERFKERIESYRFPAGRFDRFANGGRVAVFELSDVELDRMLLNEIEAEFGNYKINTELQELYIYDDE